LEVRVGGRGPEASQPPWAGLRQAQPRKRKHWCAERNDVTPRARARKQRRPGHQSWT
jgi:hypothetical protein